MANSLTSAPPQPAATGRRDDLADPAGPVRWLVFATFVVILNETVMINALPRVMADFAAKPRTAQWLTTAFMLTMAVVIPVTGWFLRRARTRVAFATAMGTFFVGTAVCATAPTFEALVAGRVVQAVGTAVMMPLLMTTIMVVVPERDRGAVMGRVTMTIALAPALGPSVSGLVLAHGSWRCVFAVVLPVAFLAAVAGLRRLDDVGVLSPARLDWLSVLLSAAGFGPLVVGVSRLGTGSGPVPLSLVAAGLFVVGVFVARQLRLQRIGVPLLDLRTLTHRRYALAVSLMALTFMGMIGSVILLSLYLQEVRGLSALQSGLLVMPGGLAMGLLGPRVGRLHDIYGARPLVLSGGLAVTVALACLTQLATTTVPAVILALHLLLMSGVAAVVSPVLATGLGALPAHLYAHGSSLLGTVQQVAAALGTALVVTVMSDRASGLAAQGHGRAYALTAGMDRAFLAITGLALLAVLVASRLPTKEP
jgi:DHA2 family lincomycin resistance protein-like MFS transporter